MHLRCVQGELLVSVLRYSNCRLMVYTTITALNILLNGVQYLKSDLNCSRTVYSKMKKKILFFSELGVKKLSKFDSCLSY